MNNLPDDQLVSSPEQYGLLAPFHDDDDDMASSSDLKSESTKRDKSAGYIALAGILVFVLTTWVIIFTNDPMSLGWFTFHPILQTSALACFTYGILTLQPTSQAATKAAGLRRHQTAMIGVGIPCILVGTADMIYTKGHHGGTHFATWHGIFGILVIACLIIQASVGAGSVWFGGIAFGGGMKAKAVWKYHRVSGYTVFTLALFTACLAGNWSSWVIGHSAGWLRFVGYTIAPLLVLGGVYTRIRPSKMKFF